MEMFRLLGFARLSCGCLIGHYHEPALDRDVDYIEAKGNSCMCGDHKRNQPVSITAHTSPVSRVTAGSAAS